jgi:uroporphyrinogen-III synthase
MRLLVTRPEPEALKLRATLEELGYEVTVAPLLSVSFENTDGLDLEGVQALIATSRNGVRALKGSAALAAARRLPMFTVGSAGAAEARALGFETVITGAGTASQLVAHVASAVDPAAGLVLHLAGDKLATNLKGELEILGFRVVQRIVYRTQPAQSFPEEVVEQLAMGEIEGVILMSPRTAATYARLVRKHGLAGSIRGIAHFCLSEAVATPLEALGTLPVEIAAAPRLEELLALIENTAAQSER